MVWIREKSIYIFPRSDESRNLQYIQFDINLVHTSCSLRNGTWEVTNQVPVVVLLYTLPQTSQEFIFLLTWEFILHSFKILWRSLTSERVEKMHYRDILKAQKDNINKTHNTINEYVLALVSVVSLFCLRPDTLFFFNDFFFNDFLMSIALFCTMFLAFFPNQRSRLGTRSCSYFILSRTSVVIKSFYFFSKYRKGVGEKFQTLKACNS